MNTICILIPYFGELPPYLSLFFLSCKKNPEIDFFFFTDDRSLKSEEKNIRVIYMDFQDMKKRVKKVLGKGSVLPFPYKLCDYKPCYGNLFSDYTEGYEYWGHCDIDTILGNIKDTLIKLEYKKYNRLFTHGHFVLYRNTPEINNAYKLRLPSNIPPTMQFEFVRKTSYSCHFDEVGMNLICSYYKLAFCKKEVSYDVSYFYQTFRLSSIPENIVCLPVWVNGKIYGYELSNEKLTSKEYMYLHFQKRRIIPPPGIESCVQFAITHKGIIPLSQEVTPILINSIATLPTKRLPKPFFEASESIITKIMKIIKKEFPVRGILCFHTIYCIIKSRRWINNHGGDDLYTKNPWFNGTYTAGGSNKYK